VKNAGKILRYQLRDVIRGRWILAYTLIFLLVTDVLFRFGGSGDRVVLSLMNVVLLLVPLVSIIFGTMYLYHAREFIVMLLAQPVDRTSLFLGLYGGMAIPLAGGSHWPEATSWAWVFRSCGTPGAESIPRSA
jgi:Cu-processing system permease protein